MHRLIGRSSSSESVSSFGDSCCSSLGFADGGLACFVFVGCRRHESLLNVCARGSAKVSATRFAAGILHRSRGAIASRARGDFAMALPTVCRMNDAAHVRRSSGVPLRPPHGHVRSASGRACQALRELPRDSLVSPSCTSPCSSNRGFIPQHCALLAPTTMQCRQCRKSFYGLGTMAKASRRTFPCCRTHRLRSNKSPRSHPRRFAL